MLKNTATWHAQIQTLLVSGTGAAESTAKALQNSSNISQARIPGKEKGKLWHGKGHYSIQSLQHVRNNLS